MEKDAGNGRMLLMPSSEVEEDAQTRIPNGGRTVEPTPEEEPPC
jgi:hypothetical protein